MHDHDQFAEVFWVNSGHGIHVLNGLKHSLKKGDVMFIRKADRHSFLGSGERRLTLTNLAMYLPVVAYLRDHYFGPNSTSELPGAFWHRTSEPQIFSLSTLQLAAVEKDADRLSLVGTDPIEIDRFVLNLASIVLDNTGRRLSGVRENESAQAHRVPLPAWLSRALQTIQNSRDIETLTTADLVAACDRTPEHVARVMRRCTGLTPSTWIRRLRIRHAAHLLNMTTQPVTDIALECGFTGMGYFYKAFQEEYGVSPVRFRRNSAVIGGSQQAAP